MSKDFFVADFEFTQYTKPVGRPRGYFSEIIEIGAIRIDGNSSITIGHIQHFVKPHFYPNHAKEMMDFCMITEQDMRTAIEFRDMLGKINSLYIPHETYFVAWGTEDYNVLKEGCQRHNLPNPILREDYLDLAAAYQLMMGDRLTTGLQKAADEQNIETEGLWHSAYDDAVNTGKILLKMLAGDWKPEDYLSSSAAMKSGFGTAVSRV